MNNWSKKIISIKTDAEFNSLAIKAFNYQIKNIPVYGEFANYLKRDKNSITHYSQIPFLPISLFKSHKVCADGKKAECIFTSSGTTGLQTSKHHIIDTDIYEKSFIEAFRIFYGDITDYCILALLPSYLERGGSSLVYMANKLIELSNSNKSGFYLDDYGKLAKTIEKLKKSNKKILLLGVTYALLDMAKKYPINMENTIIMETGGMKGRRKEMIREELHQKLTTAFKVKTIHSEYGMTEMLSQAYSKGNGVFKTPPWMKILIRDTYDPLTFFDQNRSGGINVIDLANINSCCFIETKDIGKIFSDKTFTILGRFDNSDIRGCNLMVE